MANKQGKLNPTTHNCDLYTGKSGETMPNCTKPLLHFKLTNKAPNNADPLFLSDTQLPKSYHNVEGD